MGVKTVWKCLLWLIWLSLSPFLEARLGTGASNSIHSIISWCLSASQVTTNLWLPFLFLPSSLPPSLPQFVRSWHEYVDTFLTQYFPCILKLSSQLLLFHCLNRKVLLPGLFSFLGYPFPKPLAQLVLVFTGSSWGHVDKILGLIQLVAVALMLRSCHLWQVLPSI